MTLGRYDDTTALLVVDVQVDFADPGGALYVRGGEEIVPLLNVEIATATQAGALVVYSQDWHPPSTPHFEKDGGRWPVHCVQGTPGAELVPALSICGPIVLKGVRGEDGYSAFSVLDLASRRSKDTDLDGLLRDRGIRRIVVAGLALDHCVKDTTRDARGRGYPTELLADATRPVNRRPGDGSRAVADLVDAGVIVR